MTDAPQLKLYNTLSRKKENFEPIDANNVRMYACGPTVYDYAHIGNARPVIVFDVLYRLLRHLYGEEHVTYVRNITDVDDKINARALRDYPDLPLNDAISQVTEKTTVQFHRDVNALGCLEPTHEPRATAHINGMIKMIEVLIDKGNAYEAGGEVLFDVLSMPDYGRLSNRKIEDQQAGARVATSSHKKNPGDFVLWKQSSENEPGWGSPWGTGRPGWHLECSGMSEHHLGKTFDIHGGGLDLIFPHHENEIAQSRCAHGNDKMANYWMHNGYLQVEGKKMSKSDGNFVTIKDLLETEKFGGKEWHGNILRLAMLMTHYRQPIDFSKKRLREAEDILVQLSFSHDDILEPLNYPNLIQSSGRPDNGVVEALKDDLNTHLAISRIGELANNVRSKESEFPTFLASLDLLGVKLIEPAGLDVGSGDNRKFQEYLRAQTNKRLALISDKDRAAADAIRDEILTQGIQLKDSKDPETGKRITTWEVKR